MAALGLCLPRLGLGPVLLCRRFPRGPARFGELRNLPGAPAAGPGRAMAGHNRWSKVRNVKGPRDAERSRLFQRMARMLRAAAREGGAEPALNAALAAVLEQCRTHNVPKATIEGALRAARERPAAGSRLLLEVRGPEGSLLLLDVLTDNVRRCQAELRPLLGRYGASLAEGVRHSFEAVGVVRVSSGDLAAVSSDDLARVSSQDRVQVSSPDSVRVSSQDSVRVSSQDNVRVSSQDNVRVSGQDSVRVSSDDLAGVSSSVRVSSQDNVRVSSQDNVRVSGQDSVRVSSDDLAGVSSSVRVSSQDSVRVSSQDSVRVSSSQDGLMEVALEVAAVAGAQDVVAEEEDEAELKFLCDPADLRSVRRRLEAAGLRPLSAAVEFRPRSPLTPAGGQRSAAQGLLRALAEWPELVRLYHNLGSEVSGGHPPPRGQ